MHGEADRKGKGTNTLLRRGLQTWLQTPSPLTSMSQPRVAMHRANDKLPPSPGNQTTAGSMLASSCRKHPHWFRWLKICRGLTQHPGKQCSILAAELDSHQRSRLLPASSYCLSCHSLTSELYLENSAGAFTIFSVVIHFNS